MKNKYLNYLMTTTLLVSLLFINGCKNPTDGLIVTVNSDLSENNYGFNVLNANPDLDESPQNLTIKITGPNAESVYSLDGTKKFNSEVGLFSLILKPGVTPSESNPIKFTVIIEAAGYLKSITPIEILAVGNESFRIYMVKTSAPPIGVALKEQTILLPSNGEIEETTVIEIPLTNGKQETAKIEIPKGTKMLDEEGNIVTGSVNIAMAHFDNQSQESLNSFPGGFTATNLVDKNGNAMDPVLFITAGFVSIDMSNGAQTVKSFSNPISVTMEINSNTYNTETESDVKEGDSIPTWSLDTETGQWKEEDVVVIVKNTTSNKLESVINISHLSYWNWDYKTNTCGTGSTIRFTSDATTYTSRYFEVFNSAKNGLLLMNGYLDVRNGASWTFYNAPRNFKAKLIVYSGPNYYDKGKIIGQSGLFQLCGSSISLKVDVPIIFTVTIDVSGKCKDGGNVIRPSFTVYYKEKGGKSFNELGYLKNGRLTTDKFVLGKTYIFATSYGGKLYEYERQVTQKNYTEVIALPSGTPGCNGW